MSNHRNKNNLCRKCKIIIDDRAKYCKKCAGIKYAKIRIKHRRSYKGINNPAYKNGKTLKLYFCFICGKKLGRSACQGSKYCKKCFGRGISKHHLDLNKKNNKQSNLWFLPNPHHQRFHLFAYRYILAQFGIKEILKYRTWFIKNIMKSKRKT
jgi:ribosomal protein L40E